MYNTKLSNPFYGFGIVWKYETISDSFNWQASSKKTEFEIELFITEEELKIYSQNGVFIFDKFLLEGFNFGTPNEITSYAINGYPNITTGVHTTPFLKNIEVDDGVLNPTNHNVIYDVYLFTNFSSNYVRIDMTEWTELTKNIYRLKIKFDFTFFSNLEMINIVLKYRTKI